MGIENIEILINNPASVADEIKVYVKRPLQVNAVQVTADNMAEVAAWCKGEIRICTRRPGKLQDVEYPYIKVPVLKPLTEKHTWARVGDWVLQNRQDETSFKVYSQGAFRHDFHYDWWHPENTKEDEFGQVIGADPEASGQDDETVRKLV